MLGTDIQVMSNLVRNYHPYMNPSVEDATPTAELRRVLTMTAKDMLLAYLKKSRAKRWHETSSQAVDPPTKRVHRVRFSYTPLYGFVHDV